MTIVSEAVIVVIVSSSVVDTANADVVGHGHVCRAIGSNSFIVATNLLAADLKAVARQGDVKYTILLLHDMDVA